MKAPLPRPDLARRPPRSFAWMDHRLLREGHLEAMSLPEIAVYVFLALAADRDGLSYYRREKICRVLVLEFLEFDRALRGLVEKGLVAFRPRSPRDPNGFYQVLPVPRGQTP